LGDDDAGLELLEALNGGFDPGGDLGGWVAVGDVVADVGDEGEGGLEEIEGLEGGPEVTFEDAGKASEEDAGGVGVGAAMAESGVNLEGRGVGFPGGRNDLGEAEGEVGGAEEDEGGGRGDGGSFQFSVVGEGGLD